jgi:hypothetical protein
MISSASIKSHDQYLSLRATGGCFILINTEMMMQATRRSGKMMLNDDLEVVY